MGYNVNPIGSGSFDPPILCSAGLIARCVDQRLRLDNQRLVGWNDRKLHPEVQVFGTYDRSQGLVMYGRQVFIGYGCGIRGFELVKVEDPL